MCSKLNQWEGHISHADPLAIKRDEAESHETGLPMINCGQDPVSMRLMAYSLFPSSSAQLVIVQYLCRSSSGIPQVVVSLLEERDTFASFSFLGIRDTCIRLTDPSEMRSLPWSCKKAKKTSQGERKWQCGVAP